MRRLFLIRHAESEWNAQGRWQGHADPPLTDRGRADAGAIAGWFEGRVAGVASSDLRRARQTAQIVADRLGSATVVVDANLREIDVGEFMGLTRDEIDRRWPGFVDRWRSGEVESLPGGEDRTVFRKRIMAGLESVSALASDGPLLVVTHATAIGVLEGHLGVHPGTPMPRLCGRWFELDGELRAVGDRVPVANGT